MEIDGLRAMVAGYATSTNALVALGLALNARISGIALERDVLSRTDAVLDELGAADVVALAGALELAPVLAGIRADLLFGGKLLSETLADKGWRHQEHSLLQAFGDVSGGFPILLKRLIAPQLAGLLERLEAPGASFLDVGIGVGALSIAMVRQWPGLRVVGVDPLPAAVALASANVRAAGLDGHIDVRAGAGQDLAIVDTFDLAFVPSAFIPEPQVREIVERAHVALHPGGWLVVAMVNPGPDALGAALARFRTTMWGGTVFEAGAAQGLLEECGYTEIRLHPGPAGAPVAFAAGRRLLD